MHHKVLAFFKLSKCSKPAGLFCNLLLNHSLRLLGYMIIVGNGSLAIQPRVRKLLKHLLFLLLFDNQGHLDGWPPYCSWRARTANMCIEVHLFKPPPNTEATMQRQIERQALTRHDVTPNKCCFSTKKTHRDTLLTVGPEGSQNKKKSIQVEWNSKWEEWWI